MSFWCQNILFFYLTSHDSLGSVDNIMSSHRFLIYWLQRSKWFLMIVFVFSNSNESIFDAKNCVFHLFRALFFFKSVKRMAQDIGQKDWDWLPPWYTPDITSLELPDIGGPQRAKVHPCPFVCLWINVSSWNRKEWSCLWRWGLWDGGLAKAGFVQQARSLGSEWEGHRAWPREMLRRKKERRQVTIWPVCTFIQQTLPRHSGLLQRKPLPPWEELEF